MTSQIDVRLTDWIGRREVREDTITPVPVAALSATLDLSSDLPKDGMVLPPLWHWLYFLPLYRQSEIGPDGHAKRGGFLPPVPLPRRMWAGGRFEFKKPLLVGQEIRRESTIKNVTEKSGRTGKLVFVVVNHQISCGDSLALVEEHNIVYRDLPHPESIVSASPEPPSGAEWSREMSPDDVLLFRYSALTFNSHRIHYDRRYVTTVEGYPGLIVHGPLIATLLAHLATTIHPDRSMSQFSFRAVSPIFDTASFKICGKSSEKSAGELTLWAETATGHLAMEAKARMDKSF